MNAGRLRHRVTIQQPVLTGDGSGGRTRTWSTVATVWADVTTVPNIPEVFSSEQFQTLNNFRVKMRYRTGIGTNMRLLHRGRALEILSIVNIDERNKEMTLLCREDV